MAKQVIHINNAEISLISQGRDDYISLTDIAHSQMEEHIIIKWLSLKSTIEYIGEWELLFNPGFNCTEFGTIKNTAGNNNFVLSVKQWRDANSDLKGNIRDYATINELICLSNMENLNAVFINEDMQQSERLIKLNQIVIQQMKVLQEIGKRKLLK